MPSKKGQLIRLSGILWILLSLLFTQCNKRPYKIPYEHYTAIVVGKEQCTGADSTEYWLLDFEDVQFDDDEPYGDTLSLNGTTYYHVVKTKDLAQNLQRQYLRVYVEFDISSGRISSSNCNVEMSETYDLRTITIYSQAEAR